MQAGTRQTPFIQAVLSDFNFAFSVFLKIAWKCVCFTFMYMV